MPNRQLAIFIAILLLLAACQPASATPAVTPEATAPPTAAASPTAANSRPTPSAMPTPSRPAESAGGDVVLGVVGQPDSLNPITENDPALRQIAPLLFDSLLHADPLSAELRPGLAESWQYAADGRQVTFFLSPNLSWSDGTPLTAAGVVASLQASQHPALLKFSRIEALDERTLELEFLQIDCAAVTSLALLPLLPADHILEPQPVGSGPFVVEQWSADGRTLALRRNPNSRGGGALLNSLTVRFIQPDELPIILSEGAGQFDAIGPIAGPVSPPAGFSAQTYLAPEMLYVAINYAPKNEPPLPPEVRPALVQAIDREALLAELLAGDGQLLAGTLLPGHWAAGVEPDMPAYNPDEATALLRRAGLRDTNGDGWLERDGERLELPIRLNGKNPLHQQFGWLVSSYYRDLGLFARAESVPPDSVIDDLFTHDFQLAVFNWPLLPDPDQRMFWLSAANTEGEGLNFTSYSNPQVDSLLERAAAVPGCQLAERAELYGQAQQFLGQERPVDFVLAPNEHWFVGGRLQGVLPGSFAPFTWNAGAWRVTD